MIALDKNNIVNEDQQYFYQLKEKYQATNYKNNSVFSPLYFILSKAELDILLTDFEFNWLLDNKLDKTHQIIKISQKIKEEKQQELQKQLTILYNQYSFINYYSSKTLDRPLLFILAKIKSGEKLTTSEIKWIKVSGSLNESELELHYKFCQLKEKYKVPNSQSFGTNYQSLFSILTKLEREEKLTDKNIRFLQTEHLNYALKIVEKQEAKRQSIFIELKQKYHASQYKENSTNDLLYKILHKVETNQLLTQHEFDWLSKNNLTETREIINLVELKIKYQATSSEELSPSSHLYKVLKKIDSNIFLMESDINYLKKRQLNKTVNIAINHYSNTLITKLAEGEELNETEVQWMHKYQQDHIVTIGKTKHFAKLRNSYNIYDWDNKSPNCFLYPILQKLERQERLEAQEIVELQANDLFYHKPKIYLTYHTIEAQYYEQEYQTTQNKWNLPNASSHWRKAEQPQTALKLTNNINFDKIKDSKLTSALLTTRGGAFRDIDNLDAAEKCAKEAIKYYPDSHHPYTLMGAICYDRGESMNGDYWFSEAIKRGASQESQDNEIKRSVEKMKDKQKRNEVAKYLLDKDRIRYAWAKKFYDKKLIMINSKKTHNTQKNDYIFH